MQRITRKIEAAAKLAIVGMVLILVTSVASFFFWALVESLITPWDAIARFQEQYPMSEIIIIDSNPAIGQHVEYFVLLNGWPAWGECSSSLFEQVHCEIIPFGQTESPVYEA